MRPKGLSPTLYSALAVAALALIFTTNAAGVSERVIHNFIIYPNGADPSGSLIADAVGNLYGATAIGGEHGYGTVFQLTRKPDGKWAETILHSFAGNSAAGLHDGSLPLGGLTFDASGNLYGITLLGGTQACGCGTVFELTPTAGGKWDYGVIYRFDGVGISPNGGVVFDAGGNLYSSVSEFDQTYEGAVFELVRSYKGWTEKTIYNFGSEQPRNLAIDAAGNLYGTVSTDGAFAGVFQLTHGRNGKWTENSLCGGCAATGIPSFDGAGNLYVGTTSQVLELVRKQNWRTIVISTFTPAEGTYAAGALSFDESGNLYGTNESGGEANACNNFGCGTAFKLTHEKNAEWQTSVLYTFKGNRDGGNPSAGMIFDRHGNLYGATLLGGNLACGSTDAPGCGTVFELTPTSGGRWKFGVIDRFGVGDGSGPPSGLVADASGNLYGTMSQESGGGCGMAYKLTPSPHDGWKEHILYRFKCGTSDGMWPASSLIFDSAGNLYGTTLEGGSGCPSPGCGTVFQLSPSSSGAWTENVLYSFTGGTDGVWPAGGLVFDTVGNLYGTTEYSYSNLKCNDSPVGPIGCGAVYELSPASRGSWTETTLHDFMGYPNDGAFPTAALILDQAGNLYGTTTEGGNGPCIANTDNPGCGTVFKLSPGSGGVWTENVLYNFTLSFQGTEMNPNGITMDSKGNLYTTTEYGSPASDCNYRLGCGAVWELTPSSGGRWAVIVLYNFGSSASDGEYPLGTLSFDAMGNLYGTTSAGGPSNCLVFGASGCGTVFRLSPSSKGGWTESVLHSFSGPYKDGANPATGVILDAAGNVYGTTSVGGADEGADWGGTVFEISP
jgi:uncharacterized repeat protein (TIGR03803 family)